MMLVRDILSSLLAIAVIVGTLWGLVWGFLFSVDLISSWGIHSGFLYFTGGIAFTAYYRRFWNWYLEYAETVWIKFHEWIHWR